MLKRNHLALLALCTACGPSPRPVPALPQPAGAATRLPEQPRVVWQEDAGSGVIGPLHARGNVIFASTTNRAVSAFNADDGRRYWLHRFDGPINTGVVVADGLVHFATEDLRGQAHAIEITRGRKAWDRRIGPTRQPPLIAGDNVVYATQLGWVYSLNRRSGQVAWRTRLTGAAMMAPVLSVDAIVAATSSDTIYRLDRSTGVIQTRAALPATPTGPRLQTGTSLIIPLHDGSVVTLDAQTLATRGRVNLGAPSFAEPQGDAAAAYVLTRIAEVYRISADRMERVAVLDGAARAGFLKVGDGLVAGLLDGRVVALSTSGQRLWEYRAERSVVAPITAIDDALFIALLNGEVLRLE